MFYGRKGARFMPCPSLLPAWWGSDDRPVHGVPRNFGLKKLARSSTHKEVLPRQNNPVRARGKAAATSLRTPDRSVRLSFLGVATSRCRHVKVSPRQGVA